ncbi:hypothetical protein STEG23_037858 [Scotinomys teguina]
MSSDEGGTGTRDRSSIFKVKLEEFYSCGSNTPISFGHWEIHYRRNLDPRECKPYTQGDTLNGKAARCHPRHRQNPQICGHKYLKPMKTAHRASSAAGVVCRCGIMHFRAAVDGGS